jgi:hypothetical protein
MPRPLRVFLCHAKEDKPVVRDLYHQLTAKGWMDVWLDVEKLLPGQEWDIEIEKAVEQADVVIVCLSNKSVDKEGYVQKELRFVLNIADEKPEGTIFVVPLRLDDCAVPRRIRAWQYVDYFPKDNQKWAYQRLIESLELRAGKKIGIPIEKTVTSMEDEPVRVERDRKEKAERNLIISQKAQPNTSIASVAKPMGENIFESWWKRMLLGGILGALAGVLVYLVDNNVYVSLLLPLVGSGALAGLMIYPHKVSLGLITAGFLIVGGIAASSYQSSGTTYQTYQIIDFVGTGFFLGIPTGALISRILYWLKIIK